MEPHQGESILQLKTHILATISTSPLESYTAKTYTGGRESLWYFVISDLLFRVRGEPFVNWSLLSAQRLQGSGEPAGWTEPKSILKMLLLYLWHWATTARTLMWLGTTGMDLCAACCPLIPNLIPFNTWPRQDRVTISFFSQPVLSCLLSHLLQSSGSSKKISPFVLFHSGNGLLIRSRVFEI